MFGLILSGRPVLTTAQTISPTQFAIAIPPSPPFSHIVVFLLPGVTLPPDTAAAVYVQIPPAADFRLLGAIANEKQSAIFKVNVGGAGAGEGSSGLVADGGDVDAMVDDAATPQPAAAAAAAGAAGADGAGANITLGISIEPVAAVSAALAALKPSSITSSSAPTSASTEPVKHQPGVPASASAVPTKVLAQRIIANAFNFLASFAGNTGPGGTEVVPLKSFQDWWAKFETRIERDPGFLEREEGG